MDEKVLASRLLASTSCYNDRELLVGGYSSGKSFYFTCGQQRCLLTRPTRIAPRLPGVVTPRRCRGESSNLWRAPLISTAKQWRPFPSTSPRQRLLIYSRRRTSTPSRKQASLREDFVFTNHIQAQLIQTPPPPIAAPVRIRLPIFTSSCRPSPSKKRHLG